MKAPQFVLLSFFLLASNVAQARQYPGCREEVAFIMRTDSSIEIKAIDANLRDVARYDRQAIARRGGDFSEKQAKEASTDQLLKRYIKVGNLAYLWLYNDPIYGLLRATYSSPSARELYKRPDVAVTILRHIQSELKRTAPPGLENSFRVMDLLYVFGLFVYPRVRTNLEDNWTKSLQLMKEARAITETIVPKDKVEEAFLRDVRRSIDYVSYGLTKPSPTALEQKSRQNQPLQSR